MNISNKVALITGAASGMGAATAKYLAQRNMKIVLLDANVEVAKALAKEINGLAIQCDVSNADNVEQAVAQAVEQFNAVHLAINCAGIAPAARIVGKSGPMQLDDFNRVIQINLIGTFNVMRIAAAQMIQQDTLNEDNERGVIINTASVAAYEGQIGQAAYSASKGGVASMTLPAAREFAQFGIRVVTIAPGIVATPMMQVMPEQVQQNLIAAIQFPKRLANPEEYAKLVEHVATNSYLNGEVIRLDAAIRLAPK